VTYKIFFVPFACDLVRMRALFIQFFFQKLGLIPSNRYLRASFPVRLNKIPLVRNASRE
jgi:hypothetical protein